MVTALVFNSLACLVITGNPSDTAAQLQTGHLPDRVSMSEAQRGAASFGQWVEPIKEPLIVEVGLSRLLHFPEGIRRTALSTAKSGNVVQVGPKDLLVLGRNPGTASLTVWPARPDAPPSVLVVRVRRRLYREE